MASEEGHVLRVLNMLKSKSSALCPKFSITTVNEGKGEVAHTHSFGLRTSVPSLENIGSMHSGCSVTRLSDIMCAYAYTCILAHFLKTSFHLFARCDRQRREQPGP